MHLIYKIFKIKIIFTQIKNSYYLKLLITFQQVLKLDSNYYKLADYKRKGKHNQLLSFIPFS